MKREKVEKHFAWQAGAYEELMVKLVQQYLDQNIVIQRLLPDEERKFLILGLGCGNWVLSELIFEKPPDSFIFGFDLTEDMLRAYEQKLTAFEGKYELKQGDFRTDPTGSGYDIICAGLTLHHLTWEEGGFFTKHFSPR